MTLLCFDCIFIDPLSTETMSLSAYCNLHRKMTNLESEACTHHKKVRQHKKRKCSA